MKAMLTQKRLKELLHYEPDTGVFTRLAYQGRGKCGKVAGTTSKERGYRHIYVENKVYRAARLAWLYQEGYWPEHQIDHVNRIKHDDRWANLRHVSGSCNARNCNVSKRNKSGVTGVVWLKKSKNWGAEIMVFGKAITLGNFAKKLDAAKARWKAEVKYDFPNCNTTSTAYLYIKRKGGFK